MFSLQQVFHTDNQYSGRKKIGVLVPFCWGFLIFVCSCVFWVWPTANLRPTATLEEKPPIFYCWTWWYMAWTLFWPVWASCVPSQMLAHPQPTCWQRSTEELRKFWVMQELLLNSENSSVTHSVLATRAPMKKMNSISDPVQPSCFLTYHRYVEC